MKNEIKELLLVKLWIIRIFRSTLDEFWADHIQEVIEILNQPNQTELLAIPDLAKRLQLSKPSIYRLLRSGELPYLKIGKAQLIRVRKADLETYLKNKLSSNI